jgi:DNA-binding beta-propeller fold protein YncE
VRGHLAFVSVGGADPVSGHVPAGGVLAFDTITNTIVGGVLTEGYPPLMITVDPFRPRLFVQSGYRGPNFTVIDTRTLTVVSTLSLASQLDAVDLVAFNPARTRVYAVGFLPEPVLVTVDATTLQVLSTVSLLPFFDSGAPLSPTSGEFTTLIVSGDGARVFIGRDRRLAALDAATGTIVQKGFLDVATNKISLDPTLNVLYAPQSEIAMSVIDADSLQLLRTLAIPNNVANLPLRRGDGALLIEGDWDGTNSPLSAIDPDSGQVLASTIDSGHGMVPRLDGEQLFRFQPGTWSYGQPYALRSEQVNLLDAMSFQVLGSVTLDTRSANDPTRLGFSIKVAGIPVSMPKVSLAVEYFDATLGHYFTTSLAQEITALDNGFFSGWQRTGEALPVYARRDDGPDGTVPVCRFYGLPEKGLDSHFYSASVAECAEVQQRFGDSWLLESSEVFDVYPADAATGACAFETTPVYRVYNNRPDANHRYTTSPAIRDSMVQAGGIPEGYGPNAVAFCVPR